MKEKEKANNKEFGSLKNLEILLTKCHTQVFKS